jgi:hypothetical protein
VPLEPPRPPVEAPPVALPLRPPLDASPVLPPDGASAPPSRGSVSKVGSLPPQPMKAAQAIAEATADRGLQTRLANRRRVAHDRSAKKREVVRRPDTRAAADFREVPYWVSPQLNERTSI